MLELVRSLADEGLGIVMTTHDPDHAFLVADRVLVMSRDAPPCAGPVREILTEARLSATYRRPIRTHMVEGRTFSFAEIRPRI